MWEKCILLVLFCKMLTHACMVILFRICLKLTPLLWMNTSGSILLFNGNNKKSFCMHGFIIIIYYYYYYYYRIYIAPIQFCSRRFIII